jgi:hypothetical protein
MRLFARRERPHPGAQLTLFEAEDGWRYTLRLTNLPGSIRGWRGQLAYIDAAHRVHARVEVATRTGRDCGIGNFPCRSLAMNKAWQAATWPVAGQVPADGLPHQRRQEGQAPFRPGTAPLPGDRRDPVKGSI